MDGTNLAELLERLEDIAKAAELAGVDPADVEVRICENPASWPTQYQLGELAFAAADDGAVVWVTSGDHTPNPYVDQDVLADAERF